MRILHIGASGTIGQYVCAELEKRHEVIKVGRSSGDLLCDMTDPANIKTMYGQAGEFHAVVCTAGHAHFGPFETMEEAHFYKGIKDKMMGQINLVMIGKDYIAPGGSFTLTTGILAEDPVPGSVGLSFVNGAIHSFVLAASRELKHQQRLNVIAPGLVEPAAEKLGAYFPGHIPVPMDKVVPGYLRSVEGNVNGEIVRIY